VAIILGVGIKGGLSETDMASWIFGAFVLNGILGIVASIIFRQPLVFFWTISGTVLVGPALDHLTFPEVIGAFYGTGLLLLVLGLTGWVNRIMSILPMPIIMAMVAGVFLQFSLNWIKAIAEDPWIAVPMTMAYLILSIDTKISQRIPPMIGVLVVGVLIVVLTSSFDNVGNLNFQISTPQIYQPKFSWAAMFELVLPLAVTVLAAQNAQGIAILRKHKHNPPVNFITAACGGTSLITALFGTVSTCLTGPVNAVLSSGGKIHQQYTAAISICLLAIVFGLYAPFVTKLMLATPPSFIATLAGLALLRVLQSSFVESFGRGFTLGALICFLVTLVDYSLLNIGAPFWGLVFGFITSWLLEKQDFKGI
jgi:benzoate membrane transport protein